MLQPACAKHWPTSFLGQLLPIAFEQETSAAFSHLQVSTEYYAMFAGLANSSSAGAATWVSVLRQALGRNYELRTKQYNVVVSQLKVATAKLQVNLRSAARGVEAESNPRPGRVTELSGQLQRLSQLATALNTLQVCRLP
jgi:hypothetical protein